MEMLTRVDEEPSRGAWNAACEKYGTVRFTNEYFSAIKSGKRLDEAMLVAARTIEHERLENAALEAAKSLRWAELFPAADWPIEREHEAFRVKVDALIAFEAEHKLND